jgi:hypothetical protein
MPSNGQIRWRIALKTLILLRTILYSHTAARNKATDIRIIAKLITKVHDPMFDIHISER